MKNYIAFLFLTLIISCQSTNKKATSKQENSSLHRKWTLISFNNIKETELTENKVYIDLTDKEKGTAFAGCNNISFKYNTNTSAISFTNVVSTRMMCHNNIETPFLNALRNCKSFKIENDVLYLTTKNNKSLKFVIKN